MPPVSVAQPKRGAAGMYCLDEMLRYLKMDESAQMWRAAVTGEMAEISVRRSDSLSVVTAEYVSRIVAAIRRRDCELYFDRLGRTSALAAWEGMEQSHEGVAHSPQSIPEVTRLFEFYCPFGDVTRVLGLLCAKHMARYRSVEFIDRNRNRSRVKSVSGTVIARLANKSAMRNRGSATEASLERDPGVLHQATASMAHRTELGRCILALLGATPWTRWPLHLALARCWAPMLLRQYRLFRSPDGEPAGLVTWAWLSERTISLRAHLPVWRIPLCEWNEGERLCLCDCEFSAGVAHAVREFLEMHWYPEEDRVMTYPRAQPQGPAYREWAGGERERMVDWIEASRPHGNPEPGAVTEHG